MVSASNRSVLYSADSVYSPPLSVTKRQRSNRAVVRSKPKADDSVPRPMPNPDSNGTDVAAPLDATTPTGPHGPANDFDFNEWRVGTNVIWQPVSGLDLGVEVLYASQDPRGFFFRSGDAWEGRVRVQRDF